MSELSTLRTKLQPYLGWHAQQQQDFQIVLQFLSCTVFILYIGERYAFEDRAL